MAFPRFDQDEFTGDTSMGNIMPGPGPAEPPVLTNIPSTAESAFRRGADVYFLSDRPETEEFLARTPERAYKSVLRDVRGVKPPQEGVDLVGEWNQFKQELIPQIGFDPDQINPADQAMKARQKFLDQTFGGMPKWQLDTMDPKRVTAIYKEADNVSKAEQMKAQVLLEQGQKMKAQFFQDRRQMLREQAITIRQKGEQTHQEKMAQERRTFEETQTKEKQAFTREMVTTRKLVPRVNPDTGEIELVAPEEGPGAAQKLEEKVKTFAAKDPDYKYAGPAQKKYIEDVARADLTGQPRPDMPEEVMELQELPKATQLDLKNPQHLAVLRRVKREALAEAKGDPDKAKKIFNQMLEKRGWLAPMGINLKVK